MTMIPPTVGRIVWYRGLKDRPGEQRSAAIVTYVRSHREVDLIVFYQYGVKPLLGVTLWQGEGTPPPPPYCEWMPYQKGQAAKYEQEKAKWASPTT